MVLTVRPLAAGSEKEFHHADSFFAPGEPVQVVVTEQLLHGVFKATTRTTAGTDIITSPAPGGAVILTDLIINAGKFSDGTTTVRFTDGTDTINIVVMDNTDAPLSLGLSFAGHWQGWQDARVELVTVNDVSVTVALGYMKVGPGIAIDSFAEWDSLR